MPNRKPTAIDLFSGAGGLTLGLKRAGFKVLVGVELHKEIAKTYKANHPDVKLLTKNVKYVSANKIFESAGRKEIDLVAGCPPCQGFSQLTAKWKKRDPRNRLVLEMGRIVCKIKPRMVMMENVPGITTKGKSILGEFVTRLEKLGYIVTMDVLQMADYGVPQSRRRFVLLAGLGFEIPLPKPTHSSNGKTKPWVPISKVIRGLGKPVKLAYALKNGDPEKFNWHVVRNLKPISVERLRITKEGQDRTALPKRLRPKCHKVENEGFKNVYGRMRWNSVAPTITSGCTTPCMGRFGHPTHLRTISVREAALLQSFPKNYKLRTKFIETACDLIGNALPCRFAKVVSRQCNKALLSVKKS